MCHMLYGNLVEKGEKNTGWWPEEGAELRKDGIKRKEPGKGRKGGLLAERARENGSTVHTDFPSAQSVEEPDFPEKPWG